MPYNIVDADSLDAFINSALTANTSYYVERRNLHRLFSRAVQYSRTATNNIVAPEIARQILNYLTLRNDGLSDAARLAFVVAVERLAEDLGDVNPNQEG